MLKITIPPNFDTTMGPHEKAEFLLDHVKELVVEIQDLDARITALENPPKKEE